LVRLEALAEVISDGIVQEEIQVFFSCKVPPERESGNEANELADDSVVETTDVMGCLSRVKITGASVISRAFRGRLLRTDKSSREWLVEEEA